MEKRYPGDLDILVRKDGFLGDLINAKQYQYLNTCKELQDHVISKAKEMQKEMQKKLAPEPPPDCDPNKPVDQLQKDEVLLRHSNIMGMVIAELDALKFAADEVKETYRDVCNFFRIDIDTHNKKDSDELFG